jgi:uncharacterized protein YndB with AHSA1/START domain
MTAPTVQITTPSGREVVITRVFAAPRQLVFDACTQPELIKRWMAAPGRELEICEMDLKLGGAYHWVWRGPGKRDVGMRGVYREVVPPQRFVRTETWEDWDAGDCLSSTVLVEHDGKTTTLTTTVLFPSREIRDQVLKSGLERGVTENYAKLEQLLDSLCAQATERGAELEREPS